MEIFRLKKMFIANCLSSLLVCKENMDIIKLKLAGCSPASLPRRKSLTIHRGAEPCHTLLIKPWPNLIKAKDNGTFSSLDKITFYLSALSLIKLREPPNIWHHSPAEVKRNTQTHTRTERLHKQCAHGLSIPMAHCKKKKRKLQNVLKRFLKRPN